VPSTRKVRSKSTPSSKSLPANRFINRELGWLEFNERVLDQAADPSRPLLEQVKFLAITGSNLDEFMMVRVGSLKLQFERNPMVRDPAGLTVPEQLQAVSDRCRRLVTRQYKLLLQDLEPKLVEAGITRVNLNHCSDRCAAAAETRFKNEVLAVLSPQAIYHDRPFPMLQGLGVHLCVRMKSDAKDAGESDWQFAVIPLGRVLPRMISMPSDSGYAYVLLEDLVIQFVDDFFPGREVAECVAFRTTRNADVQLREDGAADLMVGMEEVLESRRQSREVRLELSSNASDTTVAYLSETMQLTSQDLYRIDGPLDLTYLFGVHALEGFDAYRDAPWAPQLNPAINPTESMFTTIAAGDVLMIHPYERFDPVVRLIEEAAFDPDVIAIKQVLYRTSRNSPIVEALSRAAERGKYVSVIVELKARFDEARNIEWAREMETRGVQVIYGIRGFKTHAKVCIIVRREPHGLVRYMHFGTGNYNETTANLYSDVSLLTCDEALGADATSFFNCVTGASQPQQLQQLSAAPLNLRKRLMELIESETIRTRQGQGGEIIAKLNALVDTDMIDALYRASRAGVKIRLNVRGTCCLRPGVEGLSETIEVVSVVDRFLEHARIIYFRHGGDDVLFISSADWMPRNLDRRVELLIPVNDPACRTKLLDSLETYFKDNTNTFKMQSDGSYVRLQPTEAETVVRVQRVLYDKAVAAMRDADQSRRSTFETHEARRED
jgi:polyphosphate kinase